MRQILLDVIKNNFNVSFTDSQICRVACRLKSFEFQQDSPVYHNVRLQEYEHILKSHFVIILFVYS